MTPLRRPMVSSGFLFDPTLTAAIRLNTPAWATWLEQERATGFAYPLFDPAQGYIMGWMSVRTERRQRGGAYWVAFRRCQGTLRKVYIGRRAAVTPARLAAIAHALRDAAVPPKEQP
jgi:LuxR family maltose regulon positive regulatory protein